MILDTNALSALGEGNPALGKLLSSDRRHHLPVVVLGEYRFGLLRSRFRARIEVWVQQLEREFVILDVDSETARHYALVREQLRRDGKPIPHSDFGFQRWPFSTINPLSAWTPISIPSLASSGLHGESHRRFGEGAHEELGVYRLIAETDM